MTDRYKDALAELITSLREALGDQPHDFDMSDDDYLSDKRRRLLIAMRQADDLTAQPKSHLQEVAIEAAKALTDKWEIGESSGHGRSFIFDEPTQDEIAAVLLPFFQRAQGHQWTEGFEGFLKEQLDLAETDHRRNPCGPTSVRPRTLKMVMDAFQWHKQRGNTRGH